VRRILTLAVLAALVATPALAAEGDAVEARYSPAFQQCLDAPTGQSTAGMIQCVGEELKIQDAALNVAWGETTASMNARQKAGLLKAQRAWIAFRDADCASRYDPDWGSMSTISANFCMLRRTVERTIELEEFLPGEN